MIVKNRFQTSSVKKVKLPVSKPTHQNWHCTQKYHVHSSNRSVSAMKSASMWIMSEWNQTYSICDHMWFGRMPAQLQSWQSVWENPWHCDSHVAQRNNKVATINRRALTPLLFRSDPGQPCRIRGDNTHTRPDFTFLPQRHGERPPPCSTAAPHPHWPVFQLKQTSGTIPV